MGGTDLIHVYLDDFRRCPEGFVHARNAEECIALIASGDIGILSLDFDLGWGEPTGIEVARYIAESGRYPQEIYLHTSSTEGRQMMYKLLSDSLPAGSRLSYASMPEETLARAAGGGTAGAASIQEKNG
ncbi:cyclic-phosphate processing receiver domain-containing protein [Paenibacillus humicus]|uniref:cyclic-phosphate processing receiver domain-containing protein n=1 Tax=Paenibacillus humicus TaxID=412861 RepID=UPI0027D96DA4|nr:cyclic-phosphate processing receiver domain-containing protein [Paenibacillus humicus]